MLIWRNGRSESDKGCEQEKMHLDRCSQANNDYFHGHLNAFFSKESLVNTFMWV